MMIRKLRNKGTGKIGYLYANKDVNYQVLDENDCVLGVYDTLPRLIEEWEDCKSNIWYNSTISGRYTIEIDFATSKEAKEAMDKFKAWERLKAKGFEFCCDIKYESLCGNGFNIPLNAIMPPEAYTDTEVSKDLDLLFGGEE